MKNTNLSLSSELTTLATCWKLTLKNGQILGFTNYTENIIYDGISYNAESGFTPTAISSKTGLSVDNLDIEGMLNSEFISEVDITAGKYDFAEIEIFLINYENLSEGILLLRKGWIGEIQLTNGQFTAEIRGLTQKLSTNMGDLFSKLCRADFCDEKCKLNIASVVGIVSSTTDNRVFTDITRTEENGYFSFGIITFTSGANNGLSMEIKEYYDSGIELMLPMPYDISVNNTYNIRAGCDKQFNTCRDRFNNVINFRGEPHVPGLDEVMKTAGTM